VIYFGSTSPAMNEAFAALRSRRHLSRHHAAARLPFSDAGAGLHQRPRPDFLVEQNRDAQMRSLLVNELGIDPARFISILHYDGTPITARVHHRGHRRTPVAQIQEAAE
jgi:2-oxoglutarate ferredoxin oxidoreductase subunit alpha